MFRTRDKGETASTELVARSTLTPNRDGLGIRLLLLVALIELLGSSYNASDSESGNRVAPQAGLRDSHAASMVAGMPAAATDQAYAVISNERGARGGLVLRNRGQRLAAEAHTEGSSLKLDGGPEVTLRVAQARCDGRALQLEVATSGASANHVTLERGPIIESYLNGAPGIEQAFTVEAPAGVRSRSRKARS